MAMCIPEAFQLCAHTYTNSFKWGDEFQHYDDAAYHLD